MAYTPPRYDVRTFLIYIDSYENGVPIGQFRHPYHNEGGPFRSLTQLLLKLEHSMNIENVPQSFHKVRSFFPLTEYWMETPTDERRRMGKIGTFLVHILFRRNSSWHGSITWLDKKLTQNFRSVLEMIVLLNSALAETHDTPWHIADDMCRDLAE